MQKEDIDDELMEEYTKYMKFEIKVVDTIENGDPQKLDENLEKIGFVKIYEIEGTTWYLSEETSYVLILAGNGWHLYQKAMGSI